MSWRCWTELRVSRDAEFCTAVLATCSHTSTDPGTCDTPAEAIDGCLEHLRGTALSP